MRQLRAQSRIMHHASRFAFCALRFTPAPRGILLVFLLLTLALRATPLTAHRFHEDEALYTSWALLTTKDPALISVPVDKPPLHIYLLAGLFRLLGPGEASARLSSLFASVTSVALLYAVGRRAYDRPTALLAMMLYAASPFAILFAPTAFTDPLLVLWMLLGLWAALAGKSRLAGFALGLAYATKQQSVLLVPLVLLAGAVGSGESKRGLVRLPVGFLPVFALVTWWDSLRWHVQPSFWDRSLTTYGGLTLVPLSAWPERLAGWAQLLGYIFASSLLNGLLLLTLAALLWTAMRPSRSAQRVSGFAHYDLLFVAYAGAYLLLHLAVSFQVWDRYLLPLAPLLCLLLARSILHLTSLAHRLYGRFRVLGFKFRVSDIQYPISTLLVGALIIVLIRPAWRGVTSQVPIGGDHGAYEGIDQLTAYVQTHLPPEATLYYHWLGWHLGYYLREATVETIWYPDAESLAEEAAAASEAVQAIVFPDWKDDRPTRQALAERGLVLVPQFATHRRDGSRSFALYLIETTDCTDCRETVKSVVGTRNVEGTP